MLNAARSDTLVGLACGVFAGALWGLVFLTPRVLAQFGPLQLAAGRYLAYGVFALALVTPSRRRLLPALGAGEWWALWRLSLLGNTLYFVLLASAVQLGGIAMTSLVIGFLPVVVTIVGSRHDGAIPLRRLFPSLLLSVAGVLCISAQTLERSPAQSVWTQALGLLCAFGALASWTAFAVYNRGWLARLEEISAHDWSLLIGVVTGGQALVLVPFAMLLDVKHHMRADWILFGVISVGVAVFASIVGNGLWNRASRLLPLTLVGQMILFETLFALLYGFVWDHRLPTVLELLAVALVLASVLSCLAAHRPSRRDSAALKLGQE